jgi:hypothetical protein
MTNVDAITDSDAAHQAYLDTLAQQLESQVWDTPVAPAVDGYGRPISETQPPSIGRPPEEPAVQLAPEADGSPSAVRQHEIEMTLLLTKINQELPDALSALQRAKDKVRNLKLEKIGAERLLAAHRRLRTPITRKKR